MKISLGAYPTYTETFSVVCLCLSRIHLHLLRKHHQGGDVRNLHAWYLSHRKLGWGELHTEFYTACTWYTCCSLLGWRSIAWLKNESKFCHINSLQEVAVFSYWTASSCVAALVPLSRKQFNAYCLLFCVTLQDKKKSKEPKAILYLTAAHNELCFLGENYWLPLGVRDRG